MLEGEGRRGGGVVCLCYGNELHIAYHMSSSQSSLSTPPGPDDHTAFGLGQHLVERKAFENHQPERRTWDKVIDVIDSVVRISLFR